MDRELRRQLIDAGANPKADDIELWSHQQALIQAPWLCPKTAYFFMVAGFGSGKSFAGVCAILTIAARYQGHRVVCGMGTSTQTLLRKTMLSDLFKVCGEHGIPFEWNAGSSILTIGTVQFVAVATYLPDSIYAYNFSVFICDELDELPQDKAIAVFKAIQERVRIPLPDRMPFSMFLTTSQGYKGTYQIVSELKEKRINHVLIHGRTKDNRSLPEEYVQRLYAIYNEVERRVFLDGEFANLTTGRVYGEYDEALHRTGNKPFPLEPGELVKVGQDLNAGFSRGCAVVKRGGVLYVIRRWSFQEISHAANMIRRDFPNQSIEWYPDTTGREIIAGYAAEIRAAGIQCRIGTVNGAIIDRVFFVNKLFAMGKLKLWDVPETAPVSMMLKVRQFDEKTGMPEKGKGPEAVDHDSDALEYVLYRIVGSDPEFKDLWRMGLHSRERPESAVGGAKAVLGVK